MDDASQKPNDANNDQPMPDANVSNAAEKPAESADKKEGENKDSQNGKEGKKQAEEAKKEKKPRKVTIEYPIVENVPFLLNVEECVLAEVFFL